MSDKVELRNLHISAVLISGCTTVANVFIGDLEHFDVTIKSCATCTVPYALCFSPFEDTGYFSTATNFTATSILEGSATNSFVTNHISANNMNHMSVVFHTTNAGGHGADTFVGHIHGTLRK